MSAFKVAAIFAILLKVAIADNPCENNPKNNTHVFYVTDKSDCNLYYICSGQRLLGNGTCNDDLGFDSVTNTCTERHMNKFCFSTNPCENNRKESAYIMSSEHCAEYHICAKDVLRTTLTCPWSQNFNGKACVIPGSKYDICPDTRPSVAPTTTFASTTVIKTTQPPVNYCSPSNLEFYHVTDPYDCNKYYICYGNGKMSEELFCGVDEHFNAKIMICALTGTPLDYDCNSLTKMLTLTTKLVKSSTKQTSELTTKKTPGSTTATETTSRHMTTKQQPTTTKRDMDTTTIDAFTAVVVTEAITQEKVTTDMSSDTTKDSMGTTKIDAKTTINNIGTSIDGMGTTRGIIGLVTKDLETTKDSKDTTVSIGITKDNDGTSNPMGTTKNDMGMTTRQPDMDTTNKVDLTTIIMGTTMKNVDTTKVADRTTAIIDATVEMGTTKDNMGTSHRMGTTKIDMGTTMKNMDTTKIMDRTTKIMGTTVEMATTKDNMGTSHRMSTTEIDIGTTMKHVDTTKVVDAKTTVMDTTVEMGTTKDNMGTSNRMGTTEIKMGTTMKNVDTTKVADTTATIMDTTVETGRPTTPYLYVSSTDSDIVTTEDNAHTSTDLIPPTSAKTTRACEGRTSGRLAHMDNCATYYDCALEAESFLVEMNLQECKYPNLYDDKSASCKHYSNVTCGPRYEPKGSCDYARNSCLIANRNQCHMIHGTCTNLADGYQPWTGREGTEFYLDCKDERVMSKLACSIGSNRQPMKFDAVKKTCVETMIIEP